MSPREREILILVKVWGSFDHRSPCLDSRPCSASLTAGVPICSVMEAWKGKSFQLLCQYLLIRKPLVTNSCCLNMASPMGAPLASQVSTLVYPLWFWPPPLSPLVLTKWAGPLRLPAIFISTWPSYPTHRIRCTEVWPMSSFFYL